MKKLFTGIAGIAILVSMLPLISAFEAHVINVTAQIENQVDSLITTGDFDFGTVFPQEQLDHELGISFSQSALDDVTLDDVEYHILQKPKCVDTSGVYYPVTEDGQGGYVCPAGSVMMPVLCPYLSKTEITEDGTEIENDGPALSAFHGMPLPWTASTASSTEVLGRLVKLGEDFSDTWNIDLKVPCFEGECAQDWSAFVAGVNPEANPLHYIQPQENKGVLFGCDLWVEVTGTSTPPGGCHGALDLMLVLDRSGSINSSELASLKSAAHAYVNALAPSVIGVHMGQSSFSTGGTLDLHLTDSQAAIDAAIDALIAGGFTNLYSGITLAKGELDDAHPHERAAVSDAMVIITDGNPNRPGTVANARALAAAEANAARAAGIEIFVVGVGSDVDATYLSTQIADDAAHYFAVANFASLESVLLELTDCP